MEAINQTRSLPKKSRVARPTTVNADETPQSSFQFEMARRQEPLASLYRQSPRGSLGRR